MSYGVPGCICEGPVVSVAARSYSGTDGWVPIPRKFAICISAAGAEDPLLILLLPKTCSTAQGLSPAFSPNASHVAEKYGQPECVSYCSICFANEISKPGLVGLAYNQAIWEIKAGRKIVNSRPTWAIQCHSVSK